MTPKHFCCGLLIAALMVGVVKPAQAVNPEEVLIIVAATTAAAAIATVAVVASVQHRRKKIVITGCVIAAEKGMRVTDEADKKTYVLSGDTSGIKAGDRMKLEGNRAKAKNGDKSRVWETKRVIKDFGVCQSQS